MWAWVSWSPWLKFSRATSMPASTMRTSTSGSDEAGPMVAMILVRRSTILSVQVGSPRAGRRRRTTTARHEQDSGVAYEGVAYDVGGSADRRAVRDRLGAGVEGVRRVLEARPDRPVRGGGRPERGAAGDRAARPAGRHGVRGVD